MVNQASTGRSTRFALTGHSGAELTLIEAEGRSFVRKQAPSAAQGVRLARQCEKLRHAHRMGVSCPAVYRSGEIDGFFSFDMEFVPADSAAHAIMAGRELAVDGFLPQLAALPALLRQTANGIIPASLFTEKLDSVLAACRANPVAVEDRASIAAIVARLKRQNWGGIPASDCHGDLTLENVLVQQDGRVVFIDFDVPEHSSWWLDIAKLFQDLHGHWCLRHTIIADPEGIEGLNGQLALSHAAARIAPALADMIPDAATRLPSMVAFHLLRTVPYARDPRIVAYVVRRIEAVLDL